jgi:flagellar protein FliO/FliZ
MSIIARVFAGPFLGALSVTVQAQTAASPLITAAPVASTSSVWGGAWLGLVTLTMLIVLTAVVVWIYRRGSQNSVANGRIQLLATFAIGPRERLIVVRIQDRVLALGHTPTHINLLTELEDFEPIPGAGQLPVGFSGQLQSLLSGKSR